LNEKVFNVLQAREQLISVLEKYSFDAQLYGTRYSKEFLVAFIDTLKILHQKHFEASPFGNPSSLRIECSPKKYPFHEEGRQLTITLMLNNDGPGIDFDVELNVDSDLTIDFFNTY
jgi:hypothetical protein